MLILTRLPGETIRVGTNITFTVLEVQGRRVRIGVHAPAHVKVLRDELYARPAEGHFGQEEQGARTHLCT